MVCESFSTVIIIGNIRQSRHSSKVQVGPYELEILQRIPYSITTQPCQGRRLTDQSNNKDRYGPLFSLFLIQFSFRWQNSSVRFAV
jgi:hypothetical protein